MLFSLRMASTAVHRMHTFIAFLSVSILISRTSTFTLEGSETSFAQYPRWEPCQNGTISFEFKTTLPNGILLYADDGGKFDFFELKIVGGALRLRANLGDGTFILTVGQNLNKDEWHQVELKRNQHETTLIVDKIAQTRKIRGKDFEFGSPIRNSDVYIGGIPVSFYAKLSSLALPSVLFEPRFRGSVRNLLYKHCGRREVRHEMIDSDGIRLNDKDLCEEVDPCQNGGLCVSSDEAATCDCSQTDFEGEKCEKEKVPTVATFYGNEYISYSTQHLDSSNEHLSLWFKTKRSSGMLFYSGDGSDYLNIALKDGAVIVTMNMGSGVYEALIKPEDGRFDDNRWHELRLSREAREITVEVDDLSNSGTTTGSFTMLSSDVMYLGGSPNTAQLGGARIRSNFRGCLKKVRFQAESKVFDILELTKDSHEFFTKNGNILYDVCEDIVHTQPVSFSTPESYVRLPKWEATTYGKIEFTFQTNEANGLVMFNNGVQPESDLFALELLDGHLYLLLDLGSGLSKWLVSSVNVSDSAPHRVKLHHKGRTGSISIDGAALDYRTKGRGGKLDLTDMLYVGGLDAYRSQHKVPKELWSAMLGYGFVGCMEDLVINDERIDLARIGREQGASLVEYCSITEPQCEAHQCMNDGVCTEGWNRFVCDCTATSYIGHACDQAATTLTFDGRQYVQVDLPHESRTEAEDMTLRFKTKYSEGLLFTSFSSATDDKMMVLLEKGELHLLLNLGGGTKKLKTGHKLGDDNWHTARISRRAHKLRLSVDDLPWKTDSVQGDAYILEFKNINAGGMQSDEGMKHSNFIGSMQQFIFNDNHFFEMAKTGKIENIDVTAKFDDQKLPVTSPVTFRSRESYASLPTLDIHSTFALYFQIRTLELNGLLLYSGGKSQDFFSLELVDGYIHYTFNIGDGPRLLKSNNQKPLNDNSWHSVVVLRPTVSQHILKVDIFSTLYEMNSESNSIHFDLEGSFYVGGMPRNLYYALPSIVSSRDGFQGCLSSLQLNGVENDILLQGDLTKVNTNLVVSGCDGKQSKCAYNSCHNMGQCIQRWDSFICDCDMTSFSGDFCRDESIAYQFPDTPSLITFTFPADSRPNVKQDKLALGFTTSQEDAVLVRVESYNSNDFIEMELVNGNIFVVYNMGNLDHPIGELFQQVNDGEYHVVRFTRSGPNATIQVDDSKIQLKNPEGKQHSVFNEQSKVYVGGKLNETGHIFRPFRGSMAGLVFNGIRVLDLVSGQDPRVSVRGNIVKTEMKRRATDSIFPPYLQTTSQPNFSSVAISSLPDSVTTLIVDTSLVTHPELNNTTVAMLSTTPRINTTTEHLISTNQPKVETTSFQKTSTTTEEPTTVEAVTSDEFFITSGSGCGEGDDEDECMTHLLSTTDDLFVPTSTIIVHRTPPPKVESASKKPGEGSGESSSTSNDSPAVPGSRETKPEGGLNNNIKDGEQLENGIDKESGDPSDGKISDSNIALIVGICVALILAVIIILIVVVRKVKTKSAGSYKVDESKNYPVYETGSKASSVTNGGAKPGSPAKGGDGQKKDVKEWYV